MSESETLRKWRSAAGRAAPMNTPAFDRQIQMLRGSELIVGWNLEDDRPVLFYGREALRSVMESGTKQVITSVILYDPRISTQQNPLMLEYVLAMVHVAKGRDEYDNGGDLEVPDVAPMRGIEGQHKINPLAGLPGRTSAPSLSKLRIID